MEKVDVIINVYGKPWQTLCTLKSLMKYSEKHIDKIFLIKEKTQPHNENIDWIFNYFENLVVFEPSNYKHTRKNIKPEDILNIRYQYGFEKSDKKFVFITHNDVLYTGDIIGDMLNLIGDSVGIGEIGQCWNCPAKKEGLCSGENFYNYNPTYEEVINLGLPYLRTNISNINRNNPKPLPECRLNEWSCLINREINNRETSPNGNTEYFGYNGFIDTGVSWFKSLHLKGYKFVDYRKNFIHSYWSPISSGLQTNLNFNLYQISENNAKKFFTENYDNNNIFNT